MRPPFIFFKLIASRVNRLALHSEHAKYAFVDAMERLAFCEALKRLDAKRELIQRFGLSLS
ncbi:hypothetical protein AGMMS50276_04130 [Synergistales bacterium]|nr:hypothetical protein AGMMS50276_04130 [Synergistales bacterium]